jgi:hypothetical protein
MTIIKQRRGESQHGSHSEGVITTVEDGDHKERRYLANCNNKFVDPRDGKKCSNYKIIWVHA